ncbi:hypothetical protein DSO57_1036653 [Entomophthora muscae]|uniref:Uncharacterized protein n=1 Tax=Entomophthora muscae TaxID=34485 RepID=A0ACC2UJ28_9FUNG|nr:hypothetical protein DSO57_1036653 [Entomophthora muscae]
MKFLAVVTAVLASSLELSLDKRGKSLTQFWPEKAVLGQQNKFNLTFYEACKWEGAFNVTFYFSNNTGEVGSLYPIETKHYSVSGIKTLGSTDYTAITPSNDNKTILAEKYVGLNYLVIAKAHADIGFNFWYVAPKQKANVNVTIVSKCDNESKPEILSSIDPENPGPTLVASSYPLSATLALSIALVSALMY